MMPTPMHRRGNYSSGDDFVLEYGELRFTFNERDFRERCEQAARRLGFLDAMVEEDEAEDLINLVVNGEVLRPGVGPRRARQRMLDRAGWSLGPLARALAAPADLPRRLA